MFVNLHVHDAKGSLLDSILTVEQAVSFAKESGQGAIAFTNHGYMSSYVDAVKEGLAKNVKVLVGNEVYEVDDLSDRNDTKDHVQQRYHLVLIAKNQQGYHNLLQLTSKACTEDFYKKPRVNIEDIRAHGWGKGIICLTACMAGRLSRLLSDYDTSSAALFVKSLQETFDYVAVEIQSHSSEEQYNANVRLVQFANTYRLPIVATCDAHYLAKTDEKAHSVFVRIGQDRDVGESYEGCYLQTEDEVRETLDRQIQILDAERAIEETQHIADMVEPIDIGLNNENQMPVINIPEGYKTHMDYLRHLIYSTFDEKFGNMTEEEQQIRRDRIETELPVIDYLGYVDYFLMCYMLLNEAKRRHIPLGYARGSAAGCLCLYLLNITQIDSVRWDLDFSRFANKGRKSLADIDIDISKSRRREVVDIACELFGAENVAPIATFNTLSTKVAIRDIGKVLDEDSSSPYYKRLPYSIRNEVAGLIPTIKTLNDLGEETEKEVLLKDLVSKNERLKSCREQYPLWFDYVMRLEGLPKSVGRHAAGTLITPKPVSYYMPLRLDSDKCVMAQLEMHNAMDDIKTVKMDFLGLKGLDTVDLALKNAHLSWQDIDINHLDFNDKEVFDSVYKSGNCTGIFQMESAEARGMNIKAQTDSIEDIIAINAFDRPGTKDSFPDYCKNKQDPDSAQVVHEDIRKLLKETHCVLLYQEQTLNIFRYAGFPEDEVDNARRAIGKKKADVMQSLYVKFKEGLAAKGWDESAIDGMWETVLKQASYSFNKCVSGNTRFYIDSNKKGAYAPTIAEMYKLKHDNEFAKTTGHVPLRKKYLHTYGKALSMFDDGRIRPNQIVDIRYAGVRKTYRVTLQSGKFIDCTDNHKFPTDHGELQLKDILVGYKLFVKGGEKGFPVLCEEIVSITENGCEDVYDVEMADPHHNFVIDNGIVTCNSHSCAYGLFSYLTAWLKVHYPVEFMAACLTADSDNTTKLSILINECKRLGIEVLPPNINRSETDFTPDAANKRILFGLGAVKGIGESAIQNIIANRPYTTFKDYLSKVKDRTATIALIKAGAFSVEKKYDIMRFYANSLYEPKQFEPLSSLPTKKELIVKWGLDPSIYVKTVKGRQSTDKERLMADYNLIRQNQFDEDEANRKKAFFDDFEQKYMSESWLWEFEALSMFVSGDPLETVKAHVTDYAKVQAGSNAVLVGIIVGLTKKKDKNGNLYCHADLYTPFGVVEITCWSSIFRLYSNLLNKGSCVAVHGKKSEQNALMVDRVKTYQKWLEDRQIAMEVGQFK